MGVGGTVSGADATVGINVRFEAIWACTVIDPGAFLLQIWSFGGECNHHAGREPYPEYAKGDEFQRQA